MKILLHSPVSTVRRNGNRQTSAGWVSILREAGHEVKLISSYEGEMADLLIALHANKSRSALLDFQESIPEGSIILALTGTDIYPAPDVEAVDSMQRSDSLITLQRNAVSRIPSELKDRVVTIIQSARKLATNAVGDSNHFDVCVVGHLRDVKDPLLAARAARDLPVTSRIRIRHAGGILDPKYAALVAREEKENTRYHWLGELSENETASLIASCDLMVLSSHSEGGARVVGESIVQGTPVISTQIDGVSGLLGDDYPGLFPVGDAPALTDLIQQCEENTVFYEALKRTSSHLAAQFSPESEQAALLSLVNSFET